MTKYVATIERFIVHIKRYPEIYIGFLVIILGIGIGIFKVITYFVNNKFYTSEQYENEQCEGSIILIINRIIFAIAFIYLLNKLLPNLLLKLIPQSLLHTKPITFIFNVINYLNTIRIPIDSYNNIKKAVLFCITVSIVIVGGILAGVSIIKINQIFNLINIIYLFSIIILINDIFPTVIHVLIIVLVLITIVLYIVPCEESTNMVGNIFTIIIYISSTLFMGLLLFSSRFKHFLTNKNIVKK